MKKPERAQEGRMGFILAVLACLVPFLALVWASSRYYFNYPHADEWAFIHLIEQAWNGPIPWAEFYQPYNGHRLFLPQAVLLGLVRWTHWDHRYPVAANIALGACIFGLAAFLLARSTRRAGGTCPWAAFPVLSLLVFSLSQWTNWEWGWQIQIWMAVLAVYAGLAVLSVERLCGWHLLLAFLFGAAATYSFAIGAMFWGGAFVALAMRHFRGEPRRWLYLLAWALASCVLYGLYAYGYEQAEAQSASRLIQANPLKIAAYGVIYIGAGLTYFRPWAAPLVGFAGLVFGIWAHIGLWRARRVPASALAPFTALMCIAAASAALTGMARARPAVGGIWQAVNARYFTISSLYWVGVIFLLALVMQKEPLGIGWGWAHPWRRRLGGVALMMVAACALLSSRQGYFNMDEHYKVYTPEVRRMIVQELTEVPPRVRNPFAYTFPNELAFIKKQQLSIFRPDAEQRWREASGK